MKRIILTFIILCSIRVSGYGQTASDQKVFTSDIDNFWMAYDSIRTTTDSIKQLHFINTMYIGKGTVGLKAFMKARDYSDELWIKLIKKYPRFWNSIRAGTLSIKTKSKEINASILKFKTLYPGLKEAKIYFTIGGLRSGGTIDSNMVLIGAEIATGNIATDVSEFKDNWLASVFKEQNINNIIPLNIHEYVHTQQKSEGNDLLSQAIMEGSCDFITELVIGHPMQTNYIKYGKEHETALKEKFKDEMFTSAVSNWLYNGSETGAVADLGYFMGYQICKSYYSNAKNKKEAIKQVIELDYSDNNAVEVFLQKSNYYSIPINKAVLVKKFEALRPVIVRIEPFANGDTLVDSSLREIKLVFSKPMKEGYSINMGEKGKEHYPVTGVNGFSADKKTCLIKVELKPAHQYEFILTDRSFVSTDGYPIVDYAVKFKTK